MKDRKEIMKKYLELKEEQFNHIPSRYDEKRDAKIEMLSWVLNIKTEIFH